ncbi:HAD-IC family P-type ATPase [Patescibacteria group bacterium]|nr:HAD-IC family P-type ATPase [Patescibacteria group bacterium]MBU2633108.1 HAD-IC family P-type ATPase [Patescibacteria group bacterium]
MTEIQQKQKLWHSLSSTKILKELSSSPNGLSQEEADLRLAKYGKNTFARLEKYRFVKLLIRQLRSPLVFILIIAGFVTFVLGSYTDSLVILIAVTINTAIGVFQEGKASQAFAKLRDSQKKYATVVRGGGKHVIRTENIVPGDILVLSTGDQVGADARLIESGSLEIDESILTGEWMAVQKEVGKLKESAFLPEMKNMTWMNTLVTEGWGRAVVVGTGFSTEVGKIAKMTSIENAPPTPFQKNIRSLSKLLSVIVLGALVFIFVAGFLRGESVSQMLFTSVAIAVAAIPEGLPVAVSVVLAIGMSRILSKGGLVKKLNAAETLGSVDIILTDKTGTLTQAIMRVSDVITLASLRSEKKGSTSRDFLKKKDDRTQVLKMAILSTEAYIENPEENLSDWIIRGRPLEQAIVLAGVESGLYQHKLFKEQPRIDFLSFDSERRFSASLHTVGKSKTRIFVSGVPEYLLDLSKEFYKNGGREKMTQNDRDLLKGVLEEQTSNGSRVIAVAYKDGKWDGFFGNKEKMFSEGFVFGGFVIFHDPLRTDAFASIKKAKRAGVRIVMLTGDHKETARKIGEEVGICRKGEEIVTGEEVEGLENDKLKNVITRTSIFARVLPHQKLKIVEAWQSYGKTVAMTGDGVNDAPALRRAEVGIALNSGTEVAKESSEIILLNNSFSVIISAIEEGRRLLINLRKILIYLLSTGFSEIILIGASLIMGLPLPVLPAQILWANLVEEGFMNFAFAFEPKEKNIMSFGPSSFFSKRLLTAESKHLMFLLVFFTSMLLLSLFLILYFIFDYSIEYTRTIVFGTLSLDSIFFAFSLKNLRKPVWKINIFSNRYLIIAMLISLGFLVAALFVPPLMSILSLEPIGLFGILCILFVGALNLLAIETGKHFLIHKRLPIKKDLV